MSAMFHGPAALVAHQGGWDEIVLVAAPIVVIIIVLAIAKRRVDAIDHGAPDRHPANDP